MKRRSAQNVLILAVAIVVGIGLICSDSLAQAKFPARPINLWVGLPPGGSADVLARTLAEGSEKSLGQKIVVINKAGGGGTVATSLLRNEKPDGYTLLLTTDTAVTRAPHISDLQYDPFKDIDHFMLIGRWKTVWTVKGDSQFKKWSDMVDWAKKNKDQLTFGHCTASSFYFGMVKMSKKEGFTFKGVPYACDGPTMTALLGGHIMVGGGTAAPYRSHVLADNVRIILSDEKIGYAAGHGTQTTFKDMKYDFDVPLLAVILAPKGMPDNVRKALEKAFNDGMNSEIFKKIAHEQELAPQPMTGKPLFDYLKNTSATYEDLIKEAGLYKGGKK
ncbi:MAG: tripartite tricarboxylate transporter substrate binding protein [Deltaproteobacteria bacterium]|nr:tripartite tricarboxylate transporter substrate binding protein [Deltaproteobacteria bacterium]